MAKVGHAEEYIELRTADGVWVVDFSHARNARMIKRAHGKLIFPTPFVESTNFHIVASEFARRNAGQTIRGGSL